MDSDRPTDRPAVTAAACFVLLLALLVAYVAGYFSCSQKLNDGSRVFSHRWQVMLFFPAVMIEYSIAGEPEDPASPG